MPKQTLLEMVTSIMSDMDSDIVTSITDTVEAGQVASIIKDVYYQMVDNTMIPEIETVGKLATVSLVDHAGAINYLEIPAGYTEVMEVKYDIHQVSDVSPLFKKMDYLTPEAFLETVHRNLSSDGNVVHVTDPGADGIQYYVKNDVHPRFFTSFDDHFLAFDSIDMAIDTIQLTGIKSVVLAKRIPVWTVDDDFIPDIDDNLFSYLLAEAKSTAFVNLKQQANPKVDKQGREQRVRIQNHKFRTDQAQRKSTANTGPNFGRK